MRLVPDSQPAVPTQEQFVAALKSILGAADVLATRWVKTPDVETVRNLTIVAAIGRAKEGDTERELYAVLAYMGFLEGQERAAEARADQALSDQLAGILKEVEAK